jgi:hypothetical protein
VRCWRLDRVLDDLVAMRYVRRFQLRDQEAAKRGQHRGLPAILKVTDDFWRAAGVQRTRAHELKDKPATDSRRDERAAGQVVDLVRGVLDSEHRPLYWGPDPPD